MVMAASNAVDGALELECCVAQQSRQAHLFTMLMLKGRRRQGVLAWSGHGQSVVPALVHDSAGGRGSSRPPFEHLAQQWHPDNTLRPERVTLGSGKQVLWQCPKSTCQHLHVWRAAIQHRALDKGGCPFCARQRVCPATRCRPSGQPWQRSGTMRPMVPLAHPSSSPLAAASV